MFEGVPIQAVADYWNERPCNIRHSPLTVGTRGYFDEVEARKYFVEPHILRFADFPRWRRKRILKIGCGIGTDTIDFARYCARVIAGDLSEKSVEVARQRAEVNGPGQHVQFDVANAEELSCTVPVEPYDFVYSFGVIHHILESAIEAIRRYTQPGTTLKLVGYNRRSRKLLSILLGYGKGRFWQLPERVAATFFGGPNWVSRDVRSEVIRLPNRFGITELWADHIFPCWIPDAQYHYVKVWYFRMLPAPVF